MNRIKELKRTIIICFLATFAMMLLCHGFMFMNPSYSHDSLNEIIRDTGSFQTTIGRFAQNNWKSVFGKVTAPWFIGMVASACLACASVFLADAFRLKKTLSLVLLCGILTTNYTFSNSIATYMPWVDIYGGAFLCCAASFWLALRWKFSFLLGIPFLVLSLGLYQPYIVCVPALVLLWTVQALLQEKPWKEIGFALLRFAFMLLASYGAYRICLNWALARRNLTLLESDNSIASIKLIGFSNLPTLIGGAYQSFFSQLFHTLENGPAPLLFKILLLILTAGLLVLCFIRKRIPAIRIILVVLLIALIPVVFNAQYVVCEEAVYHALMVYSIFLALLLPVLLYDVQERSEIPSATAAPWKAVCTALVLGFVFFSNIRYANNIYTAKYLRERATLSLMTRILAVAEQADGYDPATMSVFLWGDLQRNPVIQTENAAFEQALGNPATLVSITYNPDPYLRNYLGLRVASDGQKNAILESGEASYLSVYPAPGFAEVVGDCLVIRVSD